MITEPQLNTWASAPSPTEMQRIRNTRTVMEDILKRKLPVDDIKRKFSLEKFDYEVYLQGSYANSTNVRYDSDVDIVVQLNSTFFSDKSQLSDNEKILHQLSHSDSLYKFDQFKLDVFEALKSELSDHVHWGDKCINIDGNTYRVEADIVPCLQYRLYKRFISHDQQHFVDGMKFFDTSNNKEIINFPKIHLENCEAKNIDTDGKFKDVVRIYKNMRNNLIDSGSITDAVMPSYFIENLLYNCSSQCFNGNYTNCMLKTLQFIFDAIQSGRITGFVCANEQDTLISQKTWNLRDLVTGINIMANYFLE